MCFVFSIALRPVVMGELSGIDDVRNNCREPGRFHLQEARFLPQLWGAAHGRERGPVGR